MSQSADGSHKAVKLDYLSETLLQNDNKQFGILPIVGCKNHPYSWNIRIKSRTVKAAHSSILFYFVVVTKKKTSVNDLASYKTIHTLKIVGPVPWQAIPPMT